MSSNAAGERVLIVGWGPIGLLSAILLARQGIGSVFLIGNTVELGQWGTTFETAVGPFLDPNYPNYPNWFLIVSVPAGQTIQYKFIKIAANGR